MLAGMDSVCWPRQGRAKEASDVQLVQPLDPGPQQKLEANNVGKIR